MKRVLKLFVFVFITFAVAFNVNAGVCDGASVREIITVTPYNPTGWNAYAYVCKYVNCRDTYTSCDIESWDAAKDHCKGTFQVPGYKNYNHTVSVAQCADSAVCVCPTCKTTCNLNTVVYKEVTVECTEGSTDCYCYEGTGPEINEAIMNDGGGGASTEEQETSKKICIKSDWELISNTNSTETISKSFGGDEGCASEGANETLKAKATEDAEAACDKLAGSTIAGDIKTTVTVTSKSTSCEDTYRVKYNVCDCDSKLYLVNNVHEAKYKTKGDKGNDIPVYCINPADEPPGKTQVKAIDATQCESSNSTPECGFSNILIEGYYRRNIQNNVNYTYAVIGAAMRLWSAHVGNSGFRDTGIADEDSTTINNDNTWLHFVPGPDINGDYLNVFKSTFQHFRDDHGYRPASVSTIYEVDTITGNGISNLLTVACSKDRAGVFCDGDTGNYLYALSLYANTVQGNKYMQQHLNEINFQDDPDLLKIVKNDPVSYSTTILGETKVQISYKLRENVEIDCSTLPDELKNSDACKVNQQAIIKDKNGNVLGTANIDKYDYCKKNYCYVTVEFKPGVLNCNVIDKFILRTVVYKNCGAGSVKSYYACSNPDKHQIMYSFEPDKNCIPGDIPIIEEMETILKCNLCNDDAKASVKACDSSSPVTNTVSDPSLNCILHKTSGKSGITPKHVYDYSDTFKVNTDICRVYCSDKVNYKLSGRKSVFNSFQLRYDIKGDLGISNDDSNKLVSMIEMQRDCVSEIFYDEPFDYVKDWSKTYGLENVEIDNWQDLYNALAEKSKSENERTEVLNKLAYDLYNCNFYSDIVGATGGKVRIPLDAVNSYDIAKKLLQNTIKYCNDNDCVSGYLKYEGGAEFINAVSPDELRVGSTENNPNLTSYADINTSSINVQYCNKGECFRQINGKYSKEDFSAAHSSILSSDNVSVLDVKVPINDYAIFSIKVTNSVYNPVLYQVQQGTGKVQVEKEADKDKYYTLKKNTFPVSSYAYSLCNKSGTDTASCKVYHQYFIPVYAEYKSSIDADHLLFSRNYNNDNFLKKLEEANKYSCDYTVTTCPPNADCGKHEGYIFRNIDLSNPVPGERNEEREGTNWDATNPNDPTYSRYVGGVINEIKDSADNNLYATDYYLEYSFVLDATSIEEIRSYNKVSNYFTLPHSCKVITDESDPLYNTYSDCKSSFLNDVRASHKYSIIVNKGDGISRYTSSKDNKGGGS